MKKIAAPNLEVIHFTTEDVIVTSGANQITAPITYSSKFVNNKYYATTGNELGQGGYYNYSGSTWYRFQYKPKNEQRFTPIIEWDRDNAENDLTYAWFAESESMWKTDFFLTKYDSLPTN